MRRPTYGEPLQQTRVPTPLLHCPLPLLPSPFLATKRRLSSLRNEAHTYPEGYEAKTRTKGAIAPTTRGKKLLVNPPQKAKHNDILTMVRVFGCLSTIVRQTVVHRAPSKGVVRFLSPPPSPPPYPLPGTSYGLTEKAGMRKRQNMDTACVRSKANRAELLFYTSAGATRARLLFLAKHP